MTTDSPLEADASAPLTIAGFRTWLRRSAPGERLVYWRGLLVRDRVPGSVLDKRNAARLDRLATEALSAADAGHVHLVQRRLCDGAFAYLAIRARKPNPRPQAQLTTRKDSSMTKHRCASVVEEAA